MFGVSESHARRRPDLASASAEFPPSAFRSCADALLCAAFRYPNMCGHRGLAGSIWSFPLRPAALVGFNPSQVHSRPRLAAISELPDPHAFSSRVRPDLFSSGWPGSPLNSRGLEKVGRTGLGRVDVGFWVSPVCDPFRDLRGARAPDGIGRDRSCLGLRLFQGCGHANFASLRRAVAAGSIPRDSPASGYASDFSRAHPIRSWGFRRNRRRRSLQRFKGADALLVPRRFESPRSKLPV